MNPALRAPILGFGLGVIAGGFEAIALSSTLKLSMDFGSALVLTLCAVGIGGLIGAAAAVPFGALSATLGRKWSAPSQHATSMAGGALLVAAFYLLPAVQGKLAAGIVAAAAAFAMLPIGLAGTVWFNARYWFRREEIGEEYRVGWKGWSLLAGLSLGLLAAGWLSSREFGNARALPGDPNVLLITVDTLRADHLSAAGDSPVQTPFLDGLAAEGIFFETAITPMPETAPAHSALMTGRHPLDNGVLSNGHSLSSGYQTLAEALADEGYATGAFLSSFAVDSRTGLDQGFEVYDDDFFPWVQGLAEIGAVRLGIRVLMRFGDPTDFPFLLERTAPATFGRALDWITINQERPFFSWVHLFEPHSPYEPHGLPGFEDNGTPGSPSIDHRDILSQEPGYPYTDEVREKLRRLYAEEVAYTDGQLAEFITAVRGLELGGPLLIVVTADHGEMLGEHGIEFNHHGIWDGAVRVPLIIVPHKKTEIAPRVSPQVRLMDIPATVLELIGLDPMEKSRGIGLVKHLTGAELFGLPGVLMGRRTASLSEGTLLGYRYEAKQEVTDESGETTLVREPVKFILDEDSREEWLFKLRPDPEERVDLAGEHAEALTAYRELLISQANKAKKIGEQGVDASTQAALQALGYME